ncbi:MAG: hypothetical protein B7Z79_05250, partial [Thiomonas sp. 20-64-9]
MSAFRLAHESVVGAGREVRGGEGFSVDLAVRAEREALEHHERAGHQRRALRDRRDDHRRHLVRRRHRH